jgi:hypothetical protein
MRSVCRSDAPTYVFEVTKKVRVLDVASGLCCEKALPCAGIYNTPVTA